MKTSLYILMFGMLLLACEQKTKSSGDENIEQAESIGIDESVIIDKITTIDSISNDQMIYRSLRWEKTVDSNSYFTEAAIVINEKGFPIKLVEYYSDDKTAKNGQINYYVEDEKLFATVHLYNQYFEDGTGKTVETRTFYENEKAIKSESRSAFYMEDLPYNEFQETDKTIIEDYENVVDMINNQGKYKTHYLSYIEAIEELYLLLGEAKETDRFVTTLKVEQPTETIIKLVDNSNKYKFTPLAVSHEIKGGKGLPEIRVIKDISIINE